MIVKRIFAIHFATCLNHLVAIVTQVPHLYLYDIEGETYLMRLNKFENEFDSTTIIFIIKFLFLILTFIQYCYIFNI